MLLHGSALLGVQPPPVAVAEFVEGVAGRGWLRSQASQGCGQETAFLMSVVGAGGQRQNSAGCGCEYEEAHGVASTTLVRPGGC